MDGSVYARIKEVSLLRGRNGTNGKFVEAPLPEAAYRLLP